MLFAGKKGANPEQSRERRASTRCSHVVGQPEAVPEGAGVQKEVFFPLGAALGWGASLLRACCGRAVPVSQTAN